jgi:diaminohydroxyphosphoribosylaminopyrimidine deaminase/5-amino-6-(5-phosphoribosylamino)uracil reductase
MPEADTTYMRLALRLSARAYGDTSPNPMVGAALVKEGKIIGKGWHRHAGEPHAEINAIADAQKRKHDPHGSTLYVTLEPCSTFGRTPPCTEAILGAGIKRVVVGGTDPNPKHSGAGLRFLRSKGIYITKGLLAGEAERLNEYFNHWIIHRQPFVLVKCALSLDGKIATRTGESKWITSQKARDYSMWLRRGVDAVLVGVNTVIVDNPALTLRPGALVKRIPAWKKLRRIILDPQARVPLNARVISDEFANLTTVVVAKNADPARVDALSRRVAILQAPAANRKLDLEFVLKELGRQNVTSLMVEGGGETNARFFKKQLLQKAIFFYAPKIIGGWQARKPVGGDSLAEKHRELHLKDVEWKKLGPDLMMSGRV